jgi:hypothetical protein
MLRLAAAIPLLALAIASAPIGAVDAQGALGSGPKNAINFGTASRTAVSLLDAGEERWFVASGSTNTTRMAATLQTNPWNDSRGQPLLWGGANETFREGRIAVFVNVEGTGKDIMGKKHADWRGFTRLGHLTPTKNSGVDRIYHQIRPTERMAFYYRVVNHSAEPVVYAFSMDHTFVLGGEGRPGPGGSFNPKSWGPLPPPWAVAG